MDYTDNTNNKENTEITENMDNTENTENTKTTQESRINNLFSFWTLQICWHPNQTSTRAIYLYQSHLGCLKMKF